MRKAFIQLLLAGVFVVGIMADASAQQQVQGQEEWWEKPLWTDPSRGFNWYPPPPQPKDEMPKVEEPPPPPKSKTIYEMATMEEVKQELRRLRDVAILNPTDANVLSYSKAQVWMYDKSHTFANVATRVAWQNPSVDYNNKHPTANFALTSKSARVARDQEGNMKDLAQNNGIFFFARSDCAYCKDQAPVLKYLSQRYGMEVLAISLDGMPIEYYQDAQMDNGISLNITNGQGIQTVPALYLVNRDSRVVTPIGTGVLSAEEIARRIHILTKNSDITAN